MVCYPVIHTCLYTSQANLKQVIEKSVHSSVACIIRLFAFYIHVSLSMLEVD